jgi:hypothetical protein
MRRPTKHLLRSRKPGLLREARIGMRQPEIAIDGAERATIAFDEHEIVKAKGDDGDEHPVLRFTGCSLTSPTGLPICSDATVIVGGKAASDIARDPKSLRMKAFVIDAHVSPRRGEQASYDMVTFIGTGPRGPARGRTFA